MADQREIISLVAAALTAADADARDRPDSGLIFRPDWLPTPRTRTQPPGANQSSHWIISRYRQWSDSRLRPQQDQPVPPPGPPEERTPPSASAAPPASTSVPPPQPQLQAEDAVAILLKRNEKELNKLRNHAFPQALGNGTASLDGFRHYMIQDKLYLETCARLKMIAVAASPNVEDVKTFEERHKKSLEYVQKLQDICVNMLGIPESTIANTPRSVELDTSEQFYKGTLRLANEDALLAYYVVLLPCVLTYWEIADRLMNDASTVKNVVYHPTWTVVNHDYSSVDKYRKFINENIAAKGDIDRWNHVFRIACWLESDLFNTGLLAPAPFRILPDGTYSIHISSVERTVLAIQNVTDFMLPPLKEHLGRYFPTDAGSCVVGMEKTGADNERWHVSATKSGYTFKNSGTDLYLGISTADPSGGEFRILQGVSDPYYWWVNPVSSQGPGPVYQIYDTANLRYTLHAAIDFLNSIRSESANFCYTPIIAHENSGQPCQMWSFSDKFEQFGMMPDDHKPADTGRNAELCKQLPEAQEMNLAFEAARAMYMGEINDLRQELKKVKSALDERILVDKAEIEMCARKTFEEMAAGQIVDRLREEIAKKDEEFKAERSKMQKQMTELERQMRAERGEMKVEQGEMKVERSEMKVERGEMKAERVEMKAERGEMKAERGEMKAERVEMQKRMTELEIQMQDELTATRENEKTSQKEADRTQDDRRFRSPKREADRTHDGRLSPFRSTKKAEENPFRTGYLAK